MKDKVEQSFRKGLVNTNLLLAHAKLLTTNSNNSLEFLDKKYLPFYYHLGKYTDPISVIQVKPKLGLPALCFLQGCSTVESWVVVGNFDRFISANISQKTKLEFVEQSNRKYDMAFVSESFDKSDLDLLWSSLKDEGLLVADYINESTVFFEFGDIHSRDVIKFDTRYGVGLIQK